MLTVNLRLNVDESRIDKITSLAYRYGFKRENPRKAWSQREYKEAIRFLAAKMFEEKLA